MATPGSRPFFALEPLIPEAKGRASRRRTRRVTTLVVIALGVALAVVTFMVLRGGDRRSFTFDPSVSVLPSVGSVAVVGGVGSWQGGSPPAVAREAERLAAANPTVARLVRLGDGERKGSVGGSRAVGRGTAWVDYPLKRPVAVDSDLPFIAIPPDAPSDGTCVTPYAAGWAHLRGTGVTTLMVTVDLRREQVVQISTNAKRGRVSPVGGKPYPSCNEG